MFGKALNIYLRGNQSTESAGVAYVEGGKEKV